MKKIFTLSCMVAIACASVSAQTLTKINADDGSALQVLHISNNGKYISGATAYTQQAFISDWQNNSTKIFGEPSDMGCELRWVTDNGIGCGFEKGGIQCDFTKNSLVYVEPQTDEPYLDAICEAMTEDTTVIVGSTFGEITAEGSGQKPIYWEHGEKKELPYPSSEEIGFNVMGATAKLVSADGKIIVGYIVDDIAAYPMIIWERQDDGTYKCDPVCKGLFQPGGYDEDKQEPITGDNPYLVFSPEAISPDGKKIVMDIQENIGEWGTEYRIGVYDIATKKLDVIVIDGENGIDAGTDCMASAIANDGTIIGFTGGGFMAPRRSFIIKPGEKQPQLLTNVFNELTDLAIYDETGFHTVVSISADGRYITGFGYGEVDAETYVLDTKKTSGIDTIEKNMNQTVEYYTIDGRKVNGPVKGLNIVKSNDGQTKKVIIK